MSTANTAAEAEPAAPPRDRFPSNRDVDKAAAELREQTTLPRPPGKVLDWEQAQKYLQLLTPEMWSHTAAYLYRLRPKIIRQLLNPDAPKYIDCMGAPFDLEYIIKRHGGGKYMIECIDTSAPRRGDSTHLFQCHFVVDDIKHEPILNYEELDVTDRANMSYLQMLQHRGVFDSKGRLVEKQQATPAANGGAITTDVIKEILGFVSQMSSREQATLNAKLAEQANGGIGKSVGDILLEQMRQNDPNKQATTLLSLISAMKPADGANLDKLLQMQSENYKTMLSMVDRIMQADRRREDGEREPRRDEMEQLEKVLNFAQKLADLRGAGGRRNGWDIGLDYAKELGVPLLQTVSNMMQIRRGGQPAPVTAAPAGPPAAFDPYSNPEALRAHSRMAAQQNPPAAGPPPGSSPAPSYEVNQDLMGLIGSYGNLVVQALNSGVRGCDFADNMTGLMGTAMHAAIAQHGEETLVQTMLRVPEIALFGEARLRHFAHEFVHYDEILSEENAGEEPES